MVFSHWYQKVSGEPLLENDPELFVARLLLSPPRAGMFALSELQETTTCSSALPEEGNCGEFSSFCVAGGTLLQLREHTKKHRAYGLSWISIIVNSFTILLAFVGIVIYLNYEDNSEKVGWARIRYNIIVWLTFFLSMLIYYKVSDYIDQRSERRRTAIQSFRSDLQLQITQISEDLQPFGYVLSAQEKNRDALEVVIQKSLEWTNDKGVPPANTEENQAMLTEVDVDMIQRGWLPRDTPLDNWLFGGLMVCLQNAKKTNAKNSLRFEMMSQRLLFNCYLASLLVAMFTMSVLYLQLIAFVGNPVALFLCMASAGYYNECTDASNLHAVFEEIINSLSPISNERVGYTMTYEIKPGWLRGITKGTIKFHETVKVEGGNSDGLMAAQIV